MPEIPSPTPPEALTQDAPSSLNTVELSDDFLSGYGGATNTPELPLLPPTPESAPVLPPAAALNRQPQAISSENHLHVALPQTELQPPSSLATPNSSQYQVAPPPENIVQPIQQTGELGSVSAENNNTNQLPPSSEHLLADKPEVLAPGDRRIDSVGRFVVTNIRLVEVVSDENLIEPRPPKPSEPGWYRSSKKALPQTTDESWYDDANVPATTGNVVQPLTVTGSYQVAPPPPTPGELPSAALQRGN